MDEKFNEALARFVRMLTAAKNSYYARNYPNAFAAQSGVSYTLEPGKRNIRVVEKRLDGSGGGGVYCFIEQGTGKIMKPGGWKAPEPKRYERGNIFRANPLEGCCAHGVEYRQGGGNYGFRPDDLEAAEKVRNGNEFALAHSKE